MCTIQLAQYLVPAANSVRKNFYKLKYDTNDSINQCVVANSLTFCHYILFVNTTISLELSGDVKLWLLQRLLNVKNCKSIM